MAEVHIVDIDGEQWDIKDRPLTQRVANLETNIDTKSNEIKVALIGEIIKSVSQGNSYHTIPVQVPSGYICLGVFVQWEYPSQELVSVSSPTNFEGSRNIYCPYTCFNAISREQIHIYGLLQKKSA